MGHLAPVADSDIIDGLSVSYLKFFGLWKIINDYRITGNKNWLLKFQVITTSLITVPSILLQFVSFLFIEVDIQKATVLNFHSLVSLQALSKVLVFWFGIDSLSKLYDLMSKNFLEKTVPDFQQKTVECIYHKITKRTNIICSASLFYGISGAFFMVLKPAVSVDYVLYYTGNMYEVTTGWKKISAGWYPLPMDKSPCYEIVFIYEFVLIFMVGAQLVVFMSVYYQILMCLYAQFLVLVSHVSNINIDPVFKEKRITYRKINAQRYTKLYRILQDHQKLLRFTEELRTVFNPLVTILLGMAMFVMIISVYQFLFGKTDPIFLLRALMFLVFQCFETSLFCYGSSFIEAASSDLQFAIYSSDWYKADLKFRKDAQMMMIRAKRGEILTAIRMYPVNAETIVSIFQFTYTVAALMNRFTE